MTTDDDLQDRLLAWAKDCLDAALRSDNPGEASYYMRAVEHLAPRQPAEVAAPKLRAMGDKTQRRTLIAA